MLASLFGYGNPDQDLIDLKYNVKNMCMKTCINNRIKKAIINGKDSVIVDIVVVLNHPHVQCTKIKDVLTHKVPYKFRILARVLEYFPRFSQPSDICKLYCTECDHL